MPTDPLDLPGAEPLAAPRRSRVAPWQWGALLLLLAAACVAITLTFFARAYPLVDAGVSLDRATATARARALATRAGFAPPGARTVARFATDDALSTFVDLDAGGPDSVRALARDREVPLFRWDVRLYAPGDPRETTVRFAPDGRPIGLARSLADAERRPTIDEAAGRRAADSALVAWTGAPAGTWRFTAASVVSKPPSGRVERTYRYERVGRRVGGAPIRAEVTLTGRGDSTATTTSAADLLGVRAFVDVPEEWSARFRERRAANDLYAAFSIPGVALFSVAALLVLVRSRGRARLRGAGWVGALVGVCMAAAGVNELPLAWFGYDTATEPGVFVASAAFGAVASGLLAGLWVAISVAAAELLTRRAFPAHHDWFGFVRHAGAPPVAGRVLGGYGLAAFGFAYVTLFYLATRSLFGWWVPTGSLDDPNLIATPLPWVGAIGTSLFAGIWEECVFRAVPLALLALWARKRAGYRWWMAAGVVVTALVFGFGHANYPSWPAYARGVELFAEAALWAVLYLTVGLPVTIVAHVLYDLAWFGLFALNGRGAGYATTATIVVAAFFLPLGIVAVQWVRRRAAGVSDAQATAAVPTLGAHEPLAEARAAADEAAVASEAAALPVAVAEDRATSGTRRRAALAVVVAASILALLAPAPTPLGSGWSAPRARVATVADSMLRARGVDPAAWDRTLVTETRPLAAPMQRLLRDSLGGADGVAAFAQRHAATYTLPAVWEVRYVKRRAPRAARAEEWTATVRPDGVPVRLVHVLPDSAPGTRPTPDAARELAARALAQRGIVAGALREVELTQTPMPRRLDTQLAWVDPAVKLPGGATARVVARLAGAEVVETGRFLQPGEAWARADQARQSRRTLVVGVVVATLAGLLVWAAAQAVRRTPPRLDDALPTRTVLWVGVGVAALSLAASALRLPATLAGWDTATPWDSFVGQLLITLPLGAAFAGLVAGGGWALADALRRRAGVARWPRADDVGGAVLYGAALGTVPVLLRLGGEALAARRWPAIAGTSLDQLVPWLSSALGTAQAPLWAPLAAVPFAALAVAVRRPARRALLVGVVTVLLALTAGGSGEWALGAAGALVAVALAGGTVWAFGRASALPWFVAPLVAAVIGGVRDARIAGTPLDRWDALLGAVVAGVVLLSVVRMAERRASAVR